MLFMENKMKKAVTDYMLWFIILLIMFVIVIALFYFGAYNIIKDALTKGLIK